MKIFEKCQSLRPTFYIVGMKRFCKTISYTGHAMFYPHKALDNFLINVKNIMRYFLLDKSHFSIAPQAILYRYNIISIGTSEVSATSGANLGRPLFKVLIFFSCF